MREGLALLATRCILLTDESLGCCLFAHRHNDTMSDEELYPISVLIEELKSDDVSVGSSLWLTALEGRRGAHEDYVPKRVVGYGRVHWQGVLPVHGCDS